MSPATFLISLFFILANIAVAQAPVSIYKDLGIVKFYSVNLSSFMGKYEVNGEPASKQMYEKYKKTWADMEKCCPCILKSYDENDMLLREEVACTDCGIGAFKEFYPNGQVKIDGQYKENNSGRWDSIYYRDYCNVRVGSWKYYNETGRLLYTEDWENDEFVKQVPEQNAVEIWKVELLLNGQKIDTQQLIVAQVPLLTISPKFKNSSRNGLNLSIRLSVSAINHKIVERYFTMVNFKDLDLLQILRESGFVPGENTTFYLLVLNNGYQLRNFKLNVVY